jgi:hypothetical protein
VHYQRFLDLYNMFRKVLDVAFTVVVCLLALVCIIGYMIVFGD